MSTTTAVPSTTQLDDLRSWEAGVIAWASGVREAAEAGDAVELEDSILELLTQADWFCRLAHRYAGEPFDYARVA